MGVGEGAFGDDLDAGVGDAGGEDGVIGLDVVGANDAAEGRELAFPGEGDFADAFDDEIAVGERVDNLDSAAGSDGLAVPNFATTGVIGGSDRADDLGIGGGHASGEGFSDELGGDLGEKLVDEITGDTGAAARADFIGFEAERIGERGVFLDDDGEDIADAFGAFIGAHATFIGDAFFPERSCAGVGDGGPRGEEEESGGGIKRECGLCFH